MVSMSFHCHGMIGIYLPCRCLQKVPVQGLPLYDRRLPNSIVELLSHYFDLCEQPEPRYGQLHRGHDHANFDVET